MREEFTAGIVIFIVIIVMFFLLGFVIGALVL